MKTKIELFNLMSIRYFMLNATYFEYLSNIFHNDGFLLLKMNMQWYYTTPKVWRNRLRCCLVVNAHVLSERQNYTSTNVTQMIIHAWTCWASLTETVYTFLFVVCLVWIYYVNLQTVIIIFTYLFPTLIGWHSRHPWILSI